MPTTLARALSATIVHVGEGETDFATGVRGARGGVVFFGAVAVPAAVAFFSARATRLLSSDLVIFTDFFLPEAFLATDFFLEFGFFVFFASFCATLTPRARRGGFRAPGLFCRIPGGQRWLSFRARRERLA